MVVCSAAQTDVLLSVVLDAASRSIGALDRLAVEGVHLCVCETFFRFSSVSFVASFASILDSPVLLSVR